MAENVAAPPPKRPKAAEIIEITKINKIIIISNYPL
jgi:hypothetical protein